jgi:hypothetical protein
MEYVLQRTFTDVFQDIEKIASRPGVPVAKYTNVAVMFIIMAVTYICYLFPSGNSLGKFPGEIPLGNSLGKFPWGIPFPS